MPYKPCPIEVSDIKLPVKLQELVEKLAENTHEVWAQQRMSEGWVYGKERNDTIKTHPCLVPYNELSETEKNYDRATSQETIKLLLKMGYRVVPPSKNSPSASPI